MRDRWKLILLDILTTVMITMGLHISSYLLLISMLFINVMLFLLVYLANWRELTIHHMLGKSKKRIWKEGLCLSGFSHFVPLFVIEMGFMLIFNHTTIYLVLINSLFIVVLIDIKALILLILLRRRL